MSEEIPQWALDRVEQEAGPRPRPECIPEDETIIIAKAFARYIAAHEQPPVDPDVFVAPEPLLGEVFEAHYNRTLQAMEAHFNRFLDRKHKEAGK